MRCVYLFQGVYVDRLHRWSRLFGDEQMLMIKSKDFFERPSETLKPILDFLDLPDWEPGSSEIRKKRNEDKYEREIDPATRRRLEDFFQPYNHRLYRDLGVAFRW